MNPRAYVRGRWVACAGAAVVALLAVSAGADQRATPADERLAFEAATIKLAAAGHEVPPPRPSSRTRLLLWLARRLGTRAVLSMVLETEGGDAEKYVRQGADGLADEEREHQEVLAQMKDGPAASGKGTIARALAAHFGFHHLDTGLLYRATGAKGGDPVAAAQGLTADDLSRPDLRSAQAGQAASRVATIPEVRAALVDFQRRFAMQEPGAVLDGRDIGTVICPQASSPWPAPKR